MDENRTNEHAFDGLLDGPVEDNSAPFLVFRKQPEPPPTIKEVRAKPTAPERIEQGVDPFSPYIMRDSEGHLCIKNPFVERIVTHPKFAQIASSSESKKIQRFIEAMGDLKYAGWTMTRLASKFGLGPADFAALWRDYHLQESFLAIAEGMPATVTDIVRDSRSIEICCPRCDGEGKVQADQDSPKSQCPVCKGAKTVFRPGDHSSRVLMWKRMGWLKDGGSPVQVNINTRTTLESVLGELQEADAVDVGDVVDVEPG